MPITESDRIFGGSALRVSCRTPTMSGCLRRVTARVLHADAPVLCGLLAEWRALIANMTVPELRVPPALTSAHHHIHLDRRAQRQGGHADRGAGRVGLGEVPAVRLVHRDESAPSGHKAAQNWSVC